MLLAMCVTVTAAQPPRDVPPLTTTGIKGLQCIVDFDDALSLGIHHAAINVRLDLLLDSMPAPFAKSH